MNLLSRVGWTPPGPDLSGVLSHEVEMKEPQTLGRLRKPGRGL